MIWSFRSMNFENIIWFYFFQISLNFEKKQILTKYDCNNPRSLKCYHFLVIVRSPFFYNDYESMTVRINCLSSKQTHNHTTHYKHSRWQTVTYFLSISILMYPFCISIFCSVRPFLFFRSFSLSSRLWKRMNNIE